MSASSPYHQVYFYPFSRLPEPSRAGSEVIINLRGCQSSPCLTSPPTFIAPVEFSTASCLFSWASLFLHISRLFGVALHQGDYCPTYNVNHSNTAMHAAMHFISTQQDPPFDIILVQEPWWCEIDDALATVSLTGWQVTLPKLSIPQNE